MDDFVVLRREIDLPPPAPSGGISQLVKRAQIIRAIIEGANASFQTQDINIYKLCKICIADTCKELIEATNWEARRWKAYNDYLNSGRDIDPELLFDIETSSRESKELYNRYKLLYKNLANNSVKLLTKECVICKSTKMN